MAIALSIPISDDETVIVYYSGVGGCIAAMTNERPGVPETPSLAVKIISSCSGGSPSLFDVANLLLIHHGGAAAPFSLTAAMVEDQGRRWVASSVTSVTPDSSFLC